MKKRDEKTVANAMLLGTALLWGSSYAVRKMGMAYMEPFFFNGVRFSVAFLFTLIFLFFIEFVKKKRRFKEKTEEEIEEEELRGTIGYQIGAGLLIGLLYAMASTLQQFALITTDVGKTAFLTSLYTLMVPMISWLFLKKAVKKQVWLGAVLAVLGLFFISAANDFRIEAGDVLLLGSALLFACQIILIGHFSKKSNPTLIVAAGMFVGAFLSFILSFIFESGNSISDVIDGIFPILYTGIVTIAIANLLQFHAQKKAEPSITAIILSLESVFSVIVGILVLNEKISQLQGVGCILILTAVIVSQLEGRKGRRNEKIKEI